MDFSAVLFRPKSKRAALVLYIMHKDKDPGGQCQKLSVTNRAVFHAICHTSKPAASAPSCRTLPTEPFNWLKPAAGLRRLCFFTVAAESHGSELAAELCAVMRRSNWK